MENIFIEFLPPWIETGMQPAFYDKESGTVLQQTARMYAKVNQLVASVNNQNATIDDYISKFNELHDYVYDYFENLDVQREIDKKLEQMSKTGELTNLIGEYVEEYVDPQINAQNTQINIIQDTVSGLSSFAPIPVSSISSMTDTSKVYVLTTDGKWYYYNTSTSTWTIGGTYQSASLGLNSVDFDNLTNRITKSVYGYSFDADSLGTFQEDYNNGSRNYSSPMLLKGGTTITVSEDFVTNYKWNLRRINPDNGLQVSSNIFSETTDTTYTLTSDEYCVFAWRPIDNAWNTTDYVVNRFHRINKSDITSILYFYPKEHVNTLIDIDVNQIYNSIFGSSARGGIRFLATPNRVGTSCFFKSKYDIKIRIKDNTNYDFGVVLWNVTDSDNYSAKSDSGWVSNIVYTVPAGEYFSFALRAKDDSDILNVTGIKDMFEFNSFADYKSTQDYINSQIAGIGDYYYSGEKLNFRYKIGYEKEDMFNTTLLTSSSQAIDTYGNYLVQLYNGGQLQIIDMTDGIETSRISGLGFQHGDACQFSNTFYDPDDVFPLMYITSDTTPGILYVLRISTLNRAEIIKSYQFPSSDGYYCGYVCDFDNNIVYSLGYKDNSFTSSTNNGTIISVYDLTDETLIDGTKYSLGLIERYEKPFIYGMQGMKFFNGMIYIVSSYNPAQVESTLKVYDPLRKLFITTFDNMPTDIKSHEVEDISFIKGTYSYEIVVATRAKYMKLTFSS